MDYDVAVVGAGPAGSVAAREIAKHGLKVLLLEEHNAVGEPVHCSGLITPRTLEAAGVQDGVVLNQVRGAVVHTPFGGRVVIGGDRVHALVIDRRRFDQILSEQAQAAGATLALGTRLVGVEALEDRVRLHVNGHSKPSTIDAKLVIGADGSRSMVARCIGAAPPQEAILAMGGEIACQPLLPDHVEIFTDPRLAPGWFGWLIPVQGATARIGIGSSDWRRHPKQMLEELKSRYPHLQTGSFLRLQGGVIPVTPLRQVYGPRAMLVGDAAAQVKPTSGGGIYTSVVSAKLCAQAALEALDGAGPELALARYQTTWMQTIGRNLARGMLLRRLLARLSPAEVDAFISLFAHDPFRRLTLSNGDIDFPISLFARLLAPSAVARALSSLPPTFWPKLLWLLVRWRGAASSPALPNRW